MVEHRSFLSVVWFVSQPWPEMAGVGSCIGVRDGWSVPSGGDEGLAHPPAPDPPRVSEAVVPALLRGDLITERPRDAVLAPSRYQARVTLFARPQSRSGRLTSRATPGA